MSSEVIAIDGPSASGKSTVARRAAKALGFLYVDSGSLYRGVTWKALEEGLDTQRGEQVAALVGNLDLQIHVDNGQVTFSISGFTPGPELRTKRVDENVSYVAATPPVRSAVNGWLRRMLEYGSLVVEGRDIGTAVFPDAVYKFYLDASPEERARRRHAEMPVRNESLSRTEVRQSLERRDTIDSQRQADPLRVAQDAVVLDTTGMSIEAVADAIVEQVRRKRESR